MWPICKNGEFYLEPLRVLSVDQMEKINEAAQAILEKTGIKVESDEALDYMDRFGCMVDRGSYRVRVPRSLTREVVAKMRQDYQKEGRPDTLPVRFSHVRFRETQYQVHHDFSVSAGGFCCFICDFDGRRRGATHDDVLCSLNLVNHLDQITYTGLPCADQSVDAGHRPVTMAAELVKYTRKIGGIETFSKRDVRYIYEISQIVAGSEEEFRQNPALVGYAEVRSPLCFDENMVNVFMEYVKLGVPQTVDTMPAGGATAPVTSAGILALGAAETISAMVLAYAIRNDAIIGIDITPSYSDMNSGIFKYGGPDRCNLLMARVQLLAEYYGCSSGVHGGKTNSCFFDEQAGAEKVSSMLLPVLAGAVGIGTVGHLENAMTFSPTQLVIDNEMVAFVRRSIRHPIMVNDETLAVDLIDSVQPGGNFISENHTAKCFRDELFLSPLFPAQSWERAHHQPEKFEMTEKAREIAMEFWKKPESPVLDDDQLRAIDSVILHAKSESLSIS